jgi:hypothetical protein
MTEIHEIGLHYQNQNIRFTKLKHLGFFGVNQDHESN